MLDYKQIKNNAIRQTEEFLLNGDWSSLRFILTSSPKQITDLEKISIFEEKVIFDNNFITNFFFEKNERKYLSDSIEIVLNLINERPEIFSDRLREYLLEKILPLSESLSGNAQEKINNAMGKYLIETRGEELTKYPRLFKNLVPKYPEQVSDFLPKIIELNRWKIVFRLFILKPKLINSHQQFVKPCINNNFFHIYRYKELKRTLEKLDKHQLLNTIKKDLKKRSQDFLMDFKTILKEDFTIEWIKNQKIHLSTAILFLKDEELKQIIEIILEFNIKWNHRDPIASQINQFLSFLQKNNKKYLLKNYIQDFKDLGYNIIREYIRFENFDKELIQEFDISIFDIVDKDPEINAQYIDKLYGKEIVKAFKYHLENYMNRPQVISVFFKAKPELTKKFTKVLENYYKNINFGGMSTRDHTFEYSSVLFGFFENYNPTFSPQFYIQKVKEFLSNPRNREYFNPWSLTLLNHFDKMGKTLQEDIIELLIERKRYNTIAFSLINKPKKFSNFISQFLEMTSDNENEIRAIIEIFKLILRTHIAHKNIFKKLKNTLSFMPNTYEKGLFLSFIGEREKAFLCFQKSLNREISISQKIFILTDYIIERLAIKNEISILSLESLKTSIEQLEGEFYYYNIIKEAGRKFPFKINFLKARFMLFIGIDYMNKDDYEQSREKLINSKNIFNDLSNSKTLPDYNKHIIELYRDVSLVLFNLIKKIETLKVNNEISKLNDELSTELAHVDFKPSIDDIKIRNLKTSLQNLYFTEEGKLTHLPFELPANFCPLPPPIDSIYIKKLEPNKKLYPWNNTNERKLHFMPLNLSNNFQRLEIIQVFAKKKKFPYIIDFEKSPLVKIYQSNSIYELGRNRFEIEIKSEGFFGKREINFCLKQNDICSVGIDMTLPVKHLDSPKTVYKNILKDLEKKYPEAHFELKNQLDQLEFAKEYPNLSPSGKLWLKLINELYLKLRVSAKDAHFLRKKAQNWNNEEKDMSPWTNELLENIFGHKHNIKSQISNGHSDHFIDDLAIEDKLLRTNENLKNKNIITQKYEKEKRQIMREGILCGFQILLVVDIRDEIRNNEIVAIKIPKCIKIFYEDDYWTAVVLFQAFTKTPANL